jgi:glucokinase
MIMVRLGVDLGGTNIAVGIVDENYQVVHKASVPTLAHRAPEAIVDDIAMLCRRVLEEQGLTLSDVGGVGIAAPGTVNSRDGYVEYANNLPFHHFPIVPLLKERLGDIPTFVDNDANAAAWGEAIAGAAKGTSNSVMITLGTGVGGGIVIENQVYSGMGGAGAELGHMVIVADGEPCSCGRKGCWEAYSSATALIRMTKEKLDECAATGRATLMTDMVAKKGRVTGRTSFDAMRAGDEAAREVVDTYIHYLACGITNLVNILRPEILSIGGGISGEGQTLIDALLPIVSKECYGGTAVGQTKICIAALGNDAGIVGAAVLGL